MSKRHMLSPCYQRLAYDGTLDTDVVVLTCAYLPVTMDAEAPVGQRVVLEWSQAMQYTLHGTNIDETVAAFRQYVQDATGCETTDLPIVVLPMTHVLPIADAMVAQLQAEGA